LEEWDGGEKVVMMWGIRGGRFFREDWERDVDGGRG
jgi:hypothetical protein